MSLQEIAKMAVKAADLAVAAYDDCVFCSVSPNFSAARADALALVAAQASEAAAKAGAAAGYSPAFDWARAQEFYAIAGVEA